MKVFLNHFQFLNVLKGTYVPPICDFNGWLYLALSLSLSLSVRLYVSHPPSLSLALSPLSHTTLALGTKAACQWCGRAGDYVTVLPL